MEIDGDINDYRDSSVFGRPLLKTESENESGSGRGSHESLIVARRDDSAYSANALLVAANKHNLLASTHGIGVLTSFACCVETATVAKFHTKISTLHVSHHELPQVLFRSRKCDLRSFAVAIERSLQAVDPSIAMPFIDGDDKATREGNQDFFGVFE